MGSSIGFYCGNTDIGDLSRFSESVGLHLIPMQLDGDVGQPWEDGPACYLSVLPREELHLYGTPPIKVSDGTGRCCFHAGLSQGAVPRVGPLEMDDDKAEFAVITRPYVQKIARWIQPASR
jgi:hypothetical protein